MILFLDTEFNGFGGELLSIALAQDITNTNSYGNFYRIVGDTRETPTKWVRQNVIPMLSKYISFSKVETKSEIRDSLQRYLGNFDKVHIIADWPEDIIHFCQLLLTDNPGERINTPPLTMEIVRYDSRSTLPHNALADAVGMAHEYAKRNNSYKQENPLSKIRYYHYNVKH